MMFNLGALSGGLGGGMSPWSMLGQAGAGLQARGRPRMVGTQGGNPALPSNWYSMQPGQSGGGGSGAGGGGMFPMGLLSMFGGGGPQGFMQMLQQQVGGLPQLQSLLGGPESPLSWTAGTETIPGGTPRHWLHSLFNRGQ